MKNFFAHAARYILLTFLPLGTLIALTAYYAVDIPYADDWAIVHLIEKFYAGTLSFADFFAQHNEHRIVTGKILMLLTAIFTGWNMYVEIAINIAFAVGTSIVIYFAIEKLTSIDAKKRAVMYFACAWIIFSFTQQECYLWGFMMQIFMSVFFNVLAIAVLVYGEGIIFPVILGVLAEFSFANGMVIWPIGLMLLFLQKRYAKMFVWLSSSIVFISLYFYDFNYGALRKPILDNIIFLLTHPHMVIIPFVTYLGSALSSYRQSIAIAAGTIGLVVYVWCLVVITKRKAWDSNKFFWLGAGMYVLLSAAVTAYGRSTSISAAMALRYVPANMLFWVAAPCMLFITLEIQEKIALKWYIIIFAVILSLSVSEDALVKARETSEKNIVFLEQLERGEYDDKFFTANVAGRYDAQRIFSLKKYGIRHFGNVPDNIVFDDFSTINFEHGALIHDEALNIELLELHDGNFFTLKGWLNSEAVKFSVVLYDDAIAFEAAIDKVPEERRHSTDAIFVRKNIYETYHRSHFMGSSIYYGNLPEGTYRIAVKVVFSDGEEKFFASDRVITR